MEIWKNLAIFIHKEILCYVALQKQNARIQNGTPLMSTLRSEGDPIAQSLQRINSDLAKVITMIGSNGTSTLQGDLK